jgi:CelD/BcsL family acetyltransferase involved in cellulose biosynthesis
MAVLVADAGHLNAREISCAAGFRVEFVRDWKQVAARWSDISSSTPFQDHRWLDAWYAAFVNFADVEPLIAIISDAAMSEQAALLPLVRRVQNGVRIVEFADLNLTDYNAPFLAFGVSRDALDGRALCRALLVALRELPERVDLVRLRKMPAIVDGRPNPLVSLGRPGSCSLNGNLIEVGEDFEVYRASIKRMQLARSWRVFSRNAGAAFQIIDNVDEALTVLDTTDAQQKERMQQLGLPFNLNDETCSKFYRDLVRRGLVEGYVIASALTCGQAIVATVLGIRQGNSFVFLRISNAGKKWSQCSPSRLIIERTMAALHRDGVRNFDLSIGNYAFKRRFGAARLPLTDVSIALGWRGILHVLRDRAAQQLRRFPWLAERVGRLRGKRPAFEEG